jgi:hypothetical protein
MFIGTNTKVEKHEVEQVVVARVYSRMSEKGLLENVDLLEFLANANVSWTPEGDVIVAWVP